MRSRRVKVGIVALAGSALLLGLLWALSRPHDPRAPGRKEALSVASQRWLQRRPSHYAFELEGAGCRQTVEVHDEVVVNMEPWNCRAIFSRPLTVGGLFAHVASYTDATVCGPNGCACDGVVVADVVYDQQWGYPADIRIFLDESQRAQGSLTDQIKGLFGDPTICTLIGMTDQHIIVHSFKALS